MPRAPLTCRDPFERGARLCAVCGLSTESPGLRRCSRLVAESPAMQALLVKAAQIAASDAPIVILGESGSGKEVLARALHANSPRAERPFVAINVAALPADLLESELFGHARGAFTGAHADHTGLFRAADGGTLLLDEIAEMPPPLQAKLLRVLQDGEIRRVGETRTRTVDVHVLAATHADLRTAVSERRFREDLYYRLAVFVLRVPALRERPEDVLPLARSFLARDGDPSRAFTPAAEKALQRWSWPGNVRELQNAVLHGAVLAGAGDVDAGHLPDDVRSRARGAPGRTLAEVERAHVLAVLEANTGNQLAAARALGIGRTTLWRKLRAWGVEA